MNIHLDVEVAKIKERYRKKFSPNRQGVEETDENVKTLIEEIDELEELSISKCEEKLNYYLDHWPDAIMNLKATEKNSDRIFQNITLRIIIIYYSRYSVWLKNLRKKSGIYSLKKVVFYLQNQLI